MKQVCNKHCQVRLDDGQIMYVRKGQVIEFNGTNKCLTPVKGAEIDFTTASRELLQAATWKFNDANDTMMETYGKELFREEGTKKSEIIEQILDIRYRNVEIDPNTVVE